MDNGWDGSAGAWIAEMGEEGDFGRRHVLDPVMRALIEGRGFRDGLDVGCGEGRFCRIMRQHGIRPIGIDPTEALLQRARQLDPAGDYRSARAEALPLEDGSADLVVSYLTLIDIDDVAAAIAEMARVLRPGGTLLIANLTGIATAGEEIGWQKDGAGALHHYGIDRYLEERAAWAEWRGIRVRNWHRPLATYMTLLLGQGLRLTRFDEPAPVGGDPDRVERYRRAPWFMVMEWEKPG